MIKFGEKNEAGISDNDIDYYKHVFIDLGCPAAYAVRLAMGHIGKMALTSLDRYIKNFMLQGYPFATAKSMAEEEIGWK